MDELNRVEVCKGDGHTKTSLPCKTFSTREGDSKTSPLKVSKTMVRSWVSLFFHVNGSLGGTSSVYVNHSTLSVIRSGGCIVAEVSNGPP